MTDDRFFGLRAFGKFLCKLCYEGVWIEHEKWPSGYNRHFHRPEKTWTPYIFISQRELDIFGGSENIKMIRFFRENHPQRSYAIYFEGNYRLKRCEGPNPLYRTCRAWGIPDRHNHRCGIAKLFGDYARMNERNFKRSREEAIHTENQRKVEELNHRLRYRSLIRKSTPNRETVNFFRSLVFGGNI